MNRTLHLILLLSLVWPSTSWAQATKRIRNAATSADTCLAAKVSGTVTDAVCARSAGGAKIKGRTDGAASAAGDVGERISGTPAANSTTTPARRWAS